MARLQDFPTVTPTSSDKLLVVQSQSQGLVPYGSKLDSANPTGTGTFTMTGNGVFSGGLKVNGNQDVATLLNLSSEYKVASTRADLMSWFVTKSGTMVDGGVAIVTVNPNYSSDGFLGGMGVQPAIIFRNSSTVIRVAFPIICGQAYYYSSDWHYSKATMTNVTPT